MSDGCCQDEEPSDSASPQPMPITDEDRTARIRPFLDDWISRLALNAWEVVFFFVDEISGHETFAEVEKHTPYLKVAIKFSRWAVDNSLDIELELVVIHELLHILTDPINAVSRRYFNESGEVGNELTGALEMVCDQVAMALYRERYPLAHRAYHDVLLTAYRGGGGELIKPVGTKGY